MQNKMYFENGICHVFTDDEISILKRAIRNLNWADIICTAEREIEIKRAYDSVYSLFLEHLD